MKHEVVVKDSKHNGNLDKWVACIVISLIMIITVVFFAYDQKASANIILKQTQKLETNDRSEY